MSGDDSSLDGLTGDEMGRELMRRQNKRAQNPRKVRRVVRLYA